MKVVVSVDSFKGSVSSMEAGEAARLGILAAAPDAEVIVAPLADGGEGTVDALVEGMGGRLLDIDVTGPLGEAVRCTYGIIESQKTAVIEMARAAGITLVPDDKKNPLKTTTYGVGEVIADAVKKGCRNFIVGLGGSVTNDAGAGMLQALGFEFFDAEGNQIGAGGQELKKIASISGDNALPELAECSFKAACDVENPLCGELGASRVFGPQKGATESMIDELDAALANFAEVTKNTFEKDCANIPGTGAAGGLGYAFVAYLNAELKSGIDIVLDELDFDSMLEGADVVVTGEGRIDYQTAMGKAPVGVAKRAKKAGARVVGIAGCTSDDAGKCNEMGLDAFFPVLDRAMSLDEAMENKTARKNIQKCVEQIFRLIAAFSR